MSDAVKPVRLSLWREGFYAFYRFRKEWGKLAIWFFIILVPVHYGMLWENGKYGFGNPVFLDTTIELFRSIKDQNKHFAEELHQLKSQDASAQDAGTGSGKDHGKNLMEILQGLQKRGSSKPKSQDATAEDVSPVDIDTQRANDKEHIENLMETMKGLQDQEPLWQNLLLQWGAALFMCFQAYVFYRFFLKSEGVDVSVKSRVKNFLYFIGAGLLWILGIWLALVLVALAIGLGGGVLFVIARLLPMPPNFRVLFSGIFFAAVIVVWVVASIYIVVRYTLVLPLASAAVKSPFNASARLTHKNICRIAISYLIFYCIIVLPFTIFDLAFCIDFGAFGMNNLPLGIGMSALLAVLTLLFSGLLGAFKSAVCRILYVEKQQADPGFTLAA